MSLTNTTTTLKIWLSRATWWLEILQKCKSTSIRSVRELKLNRLKTNLYVNNWININLNVMFSGVALRLITMRRAYSATLTKNRLLEVVWSLNRSPITLILVTNSTDITALSPLRLSMWLTVDSRKWKGAKNNFWIKFILWSNRPTFPLSKNREVSATSILLEITFNLLIVRTIASRSQITSALLN
jgi:hypothetical protein